MVKGANRRSRRGASRPRRNAGRFLTVLFLGLVALTAAAAVASALPDLVVSDTDVGIAVRSPTQGENVVLTVTVHNTGDANATGVGVGFYLDSMGTQVGSATLPSVVAGGFANATVTWAVGATSAGGHTLIVAADPAGSITEASESNNQGQKSFSVNQPPSASAGANATSGLTFDVFSFTANASTDPDGTIESYIWVFDDGSVGSGVSVQHAFSDGAQTPGKNYVVTLIVTDDDGGTDSVQIGVSVINRPPTALAPDVNGTTKTPLVFDGTGSSDSDGRIVNASWTFSDGPVMYGLAVLRSFDDDGAYSATLRVTDEDGAFDTYAVAITIHNQAPHPVVTTNPPMPFQPNQVVVFDSSNSYDVDGGITNRTWLFPGGISAFGQSASTQFAANGTYNVTLVLIDDDGAFSELTVVAVVGNQTGGGGPVVPTPPVASFTASATSVYTGEPVTFDASSSTDDVAIVSYTWDFGDNSTGMGLAVVHSWSADGLYVVVLNVTDTDANSTLASVVIRVLNRLPVALPVASPMEANSGDEITFEGTSSYDPDGNILFYRWDFGDGTFSYGATRIHSYARAGVYTVMLTVTDNDGGEHKATLEVTIHNLPPVPQVPADFSVATYQAATFSAAGSTDPDGTIVSYTWDFGDGATGSGVTARHTYTTQGTRTVTLTVRDDAGVSVQATLTVTVTNTAPNVVLTGPGSLYTAEAGTFVGNAVDRDGSITTWQWKWGDGTADSSTAGSATHTFSTKGTYNVQLIVTDNSSASTTATFTVRVLNRLPTAVISAPAAPVSVQSLEELTFGSSGSTDAETPTSLTFYWIFGDGAAATGAAPTHTYSSAGTYTVILTVVDADDGASSATLSVEVRNRAPTAAATADNTSVETGVPVAFDGSGSADADGRIVSWLWEFGDGQTSGEESPTHTFAQSKEGGGAFAVRLTVVDNLGARASTTYSLTVVNRLPTAVVDAPATIYAGVAAVFLGNGSSDPDGLVLNWTWDFGDGSLAYGPEVGHAFGEAQNYTVKLTVRDNSGGQAEQTLTLTVLARPIFDDGKPGEGPVVGVGSPGFEGAFALAALGAVAAVAALGARGRRRL